MGSSIGIMSKARGRAERGPRGGRLLVAILLLGGCAEAGPRLPPDLAAMQEKAAEEPYPDLREVPPRPRLGYGIEQRRAIVRGLAADRDNAAYEGARLRYGAGLAARPPQPPRPAATPPPATRGAPRPSAPPSDLGRAYVEERLRGAGRTGELDDLIEWMENFEDPVPGRPTAAGADDLAAALPPLPLTLAFAPGSATLEPASLLRLRALARALRETDDGRRLLVEAAAPSPALGHRRLRAVARELVALGVAADRIEMRQRGAGDGARVGWAEADAAVTADPPR